MVHVQPMAVPEAVVLQPGNLVPELLPSVMPLVPDLVHLPMVAAATPGTLARKPQPGVHLPLPRRVLPTMTPAAGDTPRARQADMMLLHQVPPSAALRVVWMPLLLVHMQLPRPVLGLPHRQPAGQEAGEQTRHPHLLPVRPRLGLTIMRPRREVMRRRHPLDRRIRMMIRGNMLWKREWWGDLQGLRLLWAFVGVGCIATSL